MDKTGWTVAVVFVGFIALVALAVISRAISEKNRKRSFPSFRREFERIRKYGGVCHIETTSNKSGLRAKIIKVGQDFVEVQKEGSSDPNELIPFSAIIYAYVVPKD